MHDITITSLDEFQKEFQAKVEQEKSGKIEITNTDYYKLQALRFIIVGGNGAFNALYGWSLGYNVLSCFLLAAVMFSGDWTLSLLQQITTSTKRAYYGVGTITKFGLIFLSLVAGTSFMLGIKHAQEIKNSNIPIIEENIRVLNNKYQETSNTKARQAREKEQEKLLREKERIGDFSPANAFPAYIAQSLGWDYEQVSTALNITWIAVLLFTGMSLSTQLGMVWCSTKERSISDDLTHRIREQARRERTHAKALAQRLQTAQEVQRLIQSPRAKPNRRKKTHKAIPRTKRPPYELVKTKVIEGSIRPRVRSLTALGMGAEEASNYLKLMLREGVLEKPGRDYRLIMQ